MSIDLREEGSPMENIREWCDFYTKILAESGGNDLAQVKLIEDDWDTRFLFLATHYYLLRVNDGESYSGLARSFALPVYANLVMNTYNMLIQFGVGRNEVFSFIPNFHIRQYDYLVYCIGAFNEYQDNDLDGELMASWFSTTAEDLVDQDVYLSSNPNTKDEYFKRAEARRGNSNYKDAIEDYTEMLRLDSGNSIAYLGRGICYECLEEYELSNKDYSSALKIDPTNVNALKLRAFNKLTIDEDREGALDDYTKAIEIDPDSWELYNRRAVAHAPSHFGSVNNPLEAFSMAIADFLRAIEIDSEKGSSIGLMTAYESRGDLHYGNERFYEAIEDYDNALSIYENQRLFTKRGNAKKANGDIGGACKDWRKVLQVERTKYDTDESIKEETKEAMESLKQFGNV
jgi:tetratricopeptide (TPR) repeat protein